MMIMGNSERPEMKAGTPEIDYATCTGCGNCEDFCPTGAVKLVNGKPVLVHPENCSYCTECEAVCPSGAIKCPFDIILVTRPEPEANC